jgi:carbonic anhydrase
LLSGEEDTSFLSLAFSQETCKSNRKNFTLKQVQWHNPSEHRINKEQFSAEMHLVHRAANNHFSIVSALYQYGAPDSNFLSKMKEKLDQLAN